jgi:hypothetical protein
VLVAGDLVATSCGRAALRSAPSGATMPPLPFFALKRARGSMAVGAAAEIRSETSIAAGHLTTSGGVFAVPVLVHRGGDIQVTFGGYGPTTRRSMLPPEGSGLRGPGGLHRGA